MKDQDYTLVTNKTALGIALSAMREVYPCSGVSADDIQQITKRIATMQDKVFDKINTEEEQTK